MLRAMLGWIMVTTIVLTAGDVVAETDIPPTPTAIEEPTPVPAHWVLAVMREAIPASSQKQGVYFTYDETAAAIAEAASARPIFAGRAGALKTAALLLAIAYYESSFDPKAIGDNNASFGLYQIQPPTVKYGEGVTGIPEMGNFAMTANVLLLPRDASLVALSLIKTSLRICGAFPWHERLGWYAAGQNGCQEKGRKKSVSRMLLAEKFVREHPVTP